MNQVELAQQLTALKQQTDKANAEIVAKVQSLEDALNAGGSTTPEVDAALADLKTSIQAVDDLNPDAPAPAPAP